MVDKEIESVLNNSHRFKKINKGVIMTNATPEKAVISLLKAKEMFFEDVQGVLGVTLQSDGAFVKGIVILMDFLGRKEVYDNRGLNKTILASYRLYLMSSKHDLLESSLVAAAGAFFAMMAKYQFLQRDDYKFWEFIEDAAQCKRIFEEGAKDHGN